MNTRSNHSTQLKGKNAEDQAVNYLQGKGFEVSARNYRYRRSEIDIIMKDKDTLVFIEVKFRKNESFGYPEEFVTDNQEKSIMSGAEQYILENQWNGNIRFDIIAIKANSEIEHFEDAFH